ERITACGNVKVGQGGVVVGNEADFMSAYAGPPENWKVCPSYFTCGTSMSNDAGSAALAGKRDFDTAKQLIGESGYKGEKIVVLDAVDQPVIHPQGRVTADLLKNLRLTLRMHSPDFSTPLS